MRDKLQVGEYCRTAGGRIFKVSEVVTFSGCNYIPKDENKTLVVSAIVKHSKNIIDMIEIEDAIKIKTGQDFETHIIIDKGDIIYLAEQMQAGLCILDKIYTKEMMEFISYKVKE